MTRSCFADSTRITPSSYVKSLLILATLLLGSAQYGCSDSGTEPEMELGFDNQSGVVITAAHYAECAGTTGFGPNRSTLNLMPGRRLSFAVSPDAGTARLSI